ncbi:methyltransferase domain-containing protein [Kitasatospora cystarginea]|uniref:Protein-L-isoaspartate O-methyltransferase n=1 Tax=Kitasatospora cystarginea TaxID=58350 RepID=A0ABP5QJ73_9ACTN
MWAPDGGAPNGFRPAEREKDPERWWSLVNADDVVVTQLDDGAEDGPGVPTSSASMPSLVASMLQHLDVRDGCTVLDIGTGTGWTAGLLCARLGSQAVTTVEVDRDVYLQAAKSLAAAGLLPVHQHHGDALLGWPFGAPYDRIHSTAAVQRVPRVWVEQTKPGGVIVTPWGTPYANAALLRLDVGERGQAAHGRFVENVSFMWMRAQRPPEMTGPQAAPTSHGASGIDPDLALERVHAAFAIGLRAPLVRYVHTWDEADPAGTYRMQLSDGHGSCASVRYHDWGGDGAVQQAGNRRLWDEITIARLRWQEEGGPELTRYGVTIAADGAQSVWLDEPRNVIRRHVS